MSTLPVDNPGIASVPVSSVGDVARLINSGREQAKYARMIVFLALGGVFLDAYDLTTLSYGIDDVVREFQLSPLLQASLGTQMFWVVSLAAIIPIFFLLAVRHEPTREDIDAIHE